MQMPLIERKKILATILHEIKDDNAVIRYVDHVIGQGQEMYEAACDLGLEGTISKRVNCHYWQKRTRDWCKNKCLQSQEFVIGGYTSPQGGREHFGSLIVGYYDNDGKLIYAGHVGGGFTEQSLSDIFQKLKKYHQVKSPFSTKVPEKGKRQTYWVKPKLIAQVHFQNWTDEKILRQPIFKGLRGDKDPLSVTEEIAVASLKEDKMPTTKTITIDKIKITNPDKTMYPSVNLSKGDLVALYSKLAPWLLPHITNRPLSLVRCPGGQQNECFYQKHATGFPAEHIKTIILESDSKKSDYIALTDEKGLIVLCQNDVLELHPWGCKTDAIEKPDRLIFDLDPGPNVTWDKVIAAAYQLRELLSTLKLTSFVKTTGGKGLHVVVPLVRRILWPQLKEFSKMLADSMMHHYPELYTTNPLKNKRHNKIFIDYLRNSRGATAIAPYSLRANQEAAVATPLTWDELARCKSAKEYTAKNILQRLAKVEDPWHGFFEVRQSITEKMRAILF